MSTLSSYDMLRMRQDQAQSLPDAVDIRRLVRTADGMGGWTTGTPDTIATGVPCRVSHSQQVEKGGQADRGLEVETWIATFEWGTDVQDGDLLVYGDIVLQVVDAKTAQSNNTAVRCACDMVKDVPWL